MRGVKYIIQAATRWHSTNREGTILYETKYSIHQTLSAENSGCKAALHLIFFMLFLKF